MTKDLPAVTAIVLNWNGYDDTIECVSSLQKVDYANFEILVVDNASTDDSVQKIVQRFPALTVIQQDMNGGYAKGNNVGIQYALQHGAEYVLLVNNDVIVTSDFLQPMVDVLELDQSTGIATCKAYFYPDRLKIYTTGGNFSRLWCRVIPASVTDENLFQEVNFISGCILLIRKKVFESVGYLDERFFMYFEDYEFSTRVNKRFKLVYTPKGIVYHKSGGGKKWSDYTPTYLYYTSRNRIWVFRDDHLAYRFYILIYGLVNAFAKSVVIFYSSFQSNGFINAWEKISVLWRGTFDGIFTNPQ